MADAVIEGREISAQEEETEEEVAEVAAETEVTEEAPAEEAK
jgi:hypothetical protein